MMLSRSSWTAINAWSGVSPRRIVHDAGEAEDVVQIVFLELFRKVELFDPQRGTLKVWLLQLAYTKSINRRYHLQRRRFYDQDEVKEEDCLCFSAGRISPSTEYWGVAPGSYAR